MGGRPGNCPRPHLLHRGGDRAAGRARRGGHRHVLHLRLPVAAAGRNPRPGYGDFPGDRPGTAILYRAVGRNGSLLHESPGGGDGLYPGRPGDRGHLRHLVSGRQGICFHQPFRAVDGSGCRQRRRVHADAGKPGHRLAERKQLLLLRRPGRLLPLRGDAVCLRGHRQRPGL